MTSVDKNNYNFLGNIVFPNIISKIHALKDDDWEAFTFRQDTAAVHRTTRTLPILFDEAFGDYPTQREWYDYFSEEVAITENFFRSYYNDNTGHIVRMIIVKLLANTEIPVHTDNKESLIRNNRHHIPIVTNPGAIFKVNGEAKHMEPFEVWEINNADKHSVVNGGEDRIHLIADWFIPKK